MFQALLYPLSGARDYDDNYHTGRVVLGLLYVGAPDDGYSKCLKHVEPIRSTIKYQVAFSWFFDSSVITMMHGPTNIKN